MTTLNTTTISSIQPTLKSVQVSQVIEQLNEITDCALINIYNDYADENRYERVYSNAEDSPIFNDTPEYIEKSKFGDYNYHDVYLLVNGQGRIVSFNNLVDDNCPIDIEELAQWIINNELYNDYNIEVTTLDDMLSSIEDNITDDKYILSKLADYLGQSLNTEQVEQLKTDNEYYDYLVSHFMNEISDYSYNDLYDLINTVGINYNVE